MKKLCFILSVAIGSLLVACSPSAAVADVPRQTMSLSKNQRVFIDAGSGVIDISNGADGVVDISGKAPSAKYGEFSVTEANDGIHIQAMSKGRPFWQGASPGVYLDVRIPVEAWVEADTYDATVNIHDFEGRANITSVAGDIRIQNSKGQFNVKANRGNVAVGESSGEIGIAGNYGLLSLQDTSGAMSAATILGTVRFAGTIKSGDTLKLETDHGPAEVQLAEDTDASVVASTTTGVVTCTVPGLQSTGPGCAGTLQDGRGQVQIRTVSGSVIVQPLR